MSPDSITLPIVGPGIRALRAYYTLFYQERWFSRGLDALTGSAFLENVTVTQGAAVTAVTSILAATITGKKTVIARAMTGPRATAENTPTGDSPQVITPERRARKVFSSPIKVFVDAAQKHLVRAR